MRQQLSAPAMALCASRLALLGGALLNGAATEAAQARPHGPELAAPGSEMPRPALGITAAGDHDVEVRSGAIVLARVPLDTPPSRRGAARIREAQVGGHRIAELRVPVRGGTSEEVWIGELGPKPPRSIWAGLAGPRDADEETSIAVEVTADGIVEYQTAAQISRCDGQPVRLFARAWDFDSARFRPAPSPLPPEAPQRVTARRGDPTMPSGAPVGGFHFTAASTTAAAGADARSLTAPSALDDGDLATAWSEGQSGDGRGEFLTARAGAGSVRVRGLRIVPGDASSPRAFVSRNRIKSLSLSLGSEPARRFEVQLPEDPAARPDEYQTPYWIPLPSPVDSSCITLVIRDVYRGSPPGRPGVAGVTAISELAIFTELDEPSGVERLVSEISTGAGCSSRVPLLQSIGRRAVTPAAEAVRTARGLGRECLLEALSRLEATSTTAAALDAVAGAVVGASATEEKLITSILRKARDTGTPVPVGRLAAVLSSSSSTSDPARAARILGTLPEPEAAAALLAAVGGGPAETRQAIVEALAQSPGVRGSQVVAALDVAAPRPDPPSLPHRQADLIRVLPSVTRGVPADRAAARESLRRSLSRGLTFEVRARAVEALGEMHEDSPSELISTRERSNDPVLRFLATRELARPSATAGRPASAARAALRAALTDADPRVRETAAQGLGGPDDLASEPLLIAAAKDEPWPFARRAQIEALSRTCGVPGRELLLRALERDVDEVRRASLVGLVRCRDGRARASLLGILKNRHAGAPLRQQAAALLGELEDQQASRELAEVLDGLVNEAEADLAIEGVAILALRSLTRLGGSDATRIAARLVLDPRHPAYHRVAIESLGELCDPDLGARTLAITAATAASPTGPTSPDRRLAEDARQAELRCRSRGGRPSDRRN